MDNLVEINIHGSIIFTLDYTGSKFCISTDSNFLESRYFVDLPKEGGFEDKDILFNIRKLIDGCNLLPAKKVGINVISNFGFSLRGRDWKVFSMILESIKHHAYAVEELSIASASVRRSNLIPFLKECKALRNLAISHCFIDKSIKLGEELLPIIPNVKILHLQETPELKSDSKVIQVLQQFSRVSPLQRISITPFFNPVTRDEVEFFLKCGTTVNFSIFPQSNFWCEQDSLETLPITVIQDTLDAYFFFKIFLKQFFFVPVILLSHFFYPLVAQYHHFFAAIIIMLMILPFEDLLPVSLRPPICSSYYRYNTFVEIFAKKINKETEPMWHKFWFIPFMIFFIFSILSLICSIFYSFLFTFTLYWFFAVLGLGIYIVHFNFMNYRALRMSSDSESSDEKTPPPKSKKRQESDEDYEAKNKKKSDSDDDYEEKKSKKSAKRKRKASSSEESSEEEKPAKKSKAQKKGKKNDDEGSDDLPEPGAIPVGNKRFVTVSEFRGRHFLNIREYYEKGGKLLPTKKGITFNKNEFESFAKAFPKIQELVAEKL
ncbi:hypothetical protein FO519_004255 [Halicephalobus sp. NKZ332]|nr:hypothetical protein FO519_004255 [Halicephalobus sp. NKZ332]